MRPFSVAYADVSHMRPFFAYPFRVLHMRFPHICVMQPVFFQSAYLRRLFRFDLHMRSFLLSKRVYVCDRPNYPIFVETRSDSEERLHYLVEEDAKNVEVFRANTAQPFSGKIISLII